MRGNHCQLPRQLPRQRSIPAYAGEPRNCNPARQSARVYPRVCGGTARYQYQWPTLAGLSPRMRGNRTAQGTGHRSWRSIPAYAGEPVSGNGGGGGGGVYPRVCGGTVSVWSRISGRRGLSPRMRGNRTAGGPRSKPRGSIPAYAGEPLLTWMTISGVRVYPRVCGGTPPNLHLGGVSQGLSPRMRGNR